MHFNAIPSKCGTTYSNNIGGVKCNYVTKATYTVNPFSTSYTVDGKGRDTYISVDNGGLTQAIQLLPGPHY